MLQLLRVTGGTTSISDDAMAHVARLTNLRRHSTGFPGSRPDHVAALRAAGKHVEIAGPGGGKDAPPPPQVRGR